MSVYNGEDFLRESVESILHQTFADFEFIIINDGSTDGTRDILDAYAVKDKRIILHHQENVGLTRSLNKGIAMSRGKYIARQDADDISAKERFAKQIAFLQNNPDIGVLGTSFHRIDKNGNILMTCNFNTEPDIVSKLLLQINQFSHGTVMMIKSVVDRVGGYREFFRYAQDHDLWLRMAEYCRVTNLPDLLYAYRDTGTTISNSKMLLQTRYAACAIESALSRRNTGYDDITNASSQRLPSVSAMGEDLQNKLTQFYLENSDQLIEGIMNEQDTEDFRYLLNKICKKHLQCQADLSNLEASLEQTKQKFEECRATAPPCGQDDKVAENLALRKEIHFHKRRLNDLLSSKSWKITQPLRKLYSLLRGD